MCLTLLKCVLTKILVNILSICTDKKLCAPEILVWLTVLMCLTLLECVVTEMLVNILNICTDEELDLGEDQEQSEVQKRREIIKSKVSPH